MIEKYDPNLELFDDPFDAWNSKEYRKYVCQASVNWLANSRDWKSFITLTFRDAVSDEFGLKKLKHLIKMLNNSAFGNNYTRIVGHSYFSYIVGVEQQERDVIHFHLIIDRPVDYQLILDYWWAQCGYVKIIPIGQKYEDKARSIAYSLKYANKEGEAIIYLAKYRYFPEVQLEWWKEDKIVVGNSSFGLLP